MKTKVKLFWRGPLSQWAKFDMYDPQTGLTFNCCEQFMMYKKAELFGDKECMEDIMSTTSPKEQKAIGRAVKNYDDEKWGAVRLEVVAYGNYLKFTQNVDAMKALLEHSDCIFAEASPYDLIWGTGIAEGMEGDTDPDAWRGQNLLGKAITMVKNRIISEQMYWGMKCSNPDEY